MSLPVIILGAGGHAGVLTDTLGRLGRAVRGLIDDDPTTHGRTVHGLEVQSPAILDSLKPEQIELVNGIGSTRAVTARQQRYEQLQAQGFRFASIIHPAAIVAESATLGQGAQVMAGAVIQNNARIGDNALINTRASIDHDCAIGDHAHIAPGATISGNVRIGAATHVGAGAVIIQGITIGSHATIGAGAVVLQDLAEQTTAVGNPARPLPRP